MIRTCALFLLATISLSCGIIPGAKPIDAAGQTAQSIEQAVRSSLGIGNEPSEDYFLLASMMAAEMDEPLQTVILWIEDIEKNPHTFLVEGNKYGGSILAMRQGILLPLNGGLWEVAFKEVESPLCNCEAWEDNDMVGECPRSVEVATGTWPRLRDIKSGRFIDLLPEPSYEVDGEILLGDLSFGAEILGTIGPYIFLTYGEQSYSCGAAHGSITSGFLVYDVEKETVVEVISEEERASIIEREQQTAFEQMRNDPAAQVQAVEDLELTQLQPHFVSGAGMTLNYQFTVDASYADSDDNWGSYSRSVVVPSQTVLGSLLLHAVIPPALSTFTALSKDIKVGGWLPISLTSEDLEALIEAFAGDPDG